jgi:hypothetical protein
MTREAPARRSSARRATLAAASAAALALSVVPDAAFTAPAPAAAIGGTAPATDSAGTLSRASFVDPPTSVRPMYRFWMPLAYTDDDELRSELRDIEAAGGGGVEVSPFIVPGAGHQTNAFLAQYGWGTPAWEHKMEVITDEAADLGLRVDQNLGPAYPPTVPTLNSFNQPQAEQQLIYGREFDPAGSSRSGVLPAPATAPPSVTTKLCAPAAPGDDVLHVEKLGGFAAGDTITVGSGATAEKVTVTALGDRAATCGDLSISPVVNAHAAQETLVDIARTTRIRTLVAQCTTACTAGATGSVTLDPSSVVDVTGQVTGGQLDYTFPAGNGNPWVVIDFLQTASGLIAQSGGYTETQPNYVVDHWSRGGVQVQTNFWDENILTDSVQANLDRIGGGSVFEDSLELGSTQKWTWSFLQSFESLRGYDPTLLLPALAGAGIQGTATPAFDLAGVGPQVREDYRQTLSDLYTTKYVAPMQRWAKSHGLQFRVQSYGAPIASGDAAAAAGIAEGESLNFNGDSAHRLAEEDYRVLAGGAHAGGRNIVSTECCAAFLGNYRSSVAGPNVGGQYSQGGDGTQVGGKYSQGLLDSIYQAYAGGVNQLVWHGYPYRDAPAGVGSAGRDGSWPGYHPWDIFGVLNVNDEFGPRQASWSDYASVNDSLARTQLVLRQGHSTSDLAVYYEDLGLSGNSVGVQQPTQHLLATDSATSSAGYTHEYLTPGALGKASADADGGLLADSSDYDALVLNNQTTMSVANAKRLLALAEDGLRIYVIGEAPSTTTGAGPDPAQLDGVVADLLAQPSVTQVAEESELPSALAGTGIRPAVTPSSSGSALGLARREADGATYDFVYNRSGSTVETDLTLSGSGTPYTLDTWTGRITPVAHYTSAGARVTVHLQIAPYDKVILALAGPSAGFGATPKVHAIASTGDVRSTNGTGLALRASEDGTFTTRLSDGTSRTTLVSGLAASRPLNEWTLRAQTWTPGENQYTTVKTDQPDVAVTAGQDGRLPSWREITGAVDLSTSSGIGTYTTAVDLPTTWKGTDGAYLTLGDVLDTATVTVNDRPVVVNQSDRGRIDLGKTLHAGANTITVRVATTMFNAVRKSGDGNYQLPAWQRTGLMGPVVLTPYRDTVLPPQPKPTAGKAATRTTLRVMPRPVPAGRRATVVVDVWSALAGVEGRVQVKVDGRVRRTATITKGHLALRLPKLRAGAHRIRAVFVPSPSYEGSASTIVRIRVVGRR